LGSRQRLAVQVLFSGWYHSRRGAAVSCSLEKYAVLFWSECNYGV